MNSVWQSLLWKEWREQRWILATIVAVCLFAPVPFAIRDPDNYLGVLAVMGLVFVPLASMFVGAWIAAGEQSRRTIHFLQSLPAPMAKPAAAKLTCAAVVVVFPALIAIVGAIVMAIYHYGHMTSRDVLDGVFVFSCIALTPLSFMLWTAAPGVNLSDEVRAGAVSLLVVCSIWLALVLVGNSVTGSTDTQWPEWLRIVAAAAPGAAAGGLFLPGDSTPDWYIVARTWPLLLVMVLSHGVLVGWYVRRFGRIAKPRFATLSAPVTAIGRGWLAPPRKSPLAAIAWKQFRESKPLALTGAAAILGFVAITATVIDGLDEGRFSNALIQATAGCWTTLGFAVAVVSGLGVFLDDLHPGLHAFWRSRPVNVDQWFAVKVTTGLLVTVLSIAAAPLIIVLILRAFYGKLPMLQPGEGFTLVSIVLAIQAGGFLVSVTAIVLLRRAATAAFATIAAAIMMIAAAEYLDLENHLMAAGVLAGLLAITAVVIAWLAVRNDWGWKG